MTGVDLYALSRASFRIVLIGPGRDPVLNLRDPGARVLFGESVLQGMDAVDSSCSLYRIGGVVVPNPPVRPGRPVLRAPISCVHSRSSGRSAARAALAPVAGSTAR
jgi:hypothetical protein